MFDAGTLILVGGLTQLLLAVSVFFYRKRRAQVEPLRIWTVGCLCLALGVISMVLPAWEIAPRMFVGYVLLSLGLALQLMAMLIFFQFRRAQSIGAKLGVAVIVYQLLPSVIHLNAGHSAAWASLAISAQFAAMVWVYGHAWSGGSHSIRLLVASNVALTAGFLTKAFEAWQISGEYNYLIHTPVQSWLYLLAFICMNLNGVGFILVLKEKEDVELERQAHLDPLTDALNRRAFLKLSKRQLTFARRHGQLLSVMICDIDHFKKINDQYGHPTGDAVIRHLVSIAHSVLRTSDSICRWGGEEFVMVLGSTDLAGATLTANRLREQFSATPARYAGKSIAATLSAGVAEIFDGETIEQAIARADQALYLAKQNGRNRVESVAAVPSAG